MTGLENLLSAYNGTAPGTTMHSIIQNILKNLNTVNSMTIYELAEACYTSPAGISRLVKKLGYKNYSYFQKGVTDCISKYEHHNRLIPLDSIPQDKELPDFFMDTLGRLLKNMRKKLDKEKIRELADAIHSSERIRIYSYSTYLAEIFLQSDIFMSGKVCDIIQQEKDIMEDATRLGENDFIVMLSPNCINGTMTERVIDTIHKNSAKVCMITDSYHLPGLKKAEISFVFEGVMHSMDMLVLQTFLCIVDLEYRRMYIDQM